MLDLKKLLKSGPLMLDGAFGTCLQSMGMPSGVCPEVWMLDHEDMVKALVGAYKNAGSRIVYAPTFSGNRIKLTEYGAEDRIDEINTTLVKWAKEAAGEDVYVAGNLTMTGKSLAPVGTLDFEELVDCYKEQVKIIAKAGADLFVIETMMSIGETRAAVLAVKEETDLPVFVTMTFEPDGRTLYGTDPVTALVTLQSMGIDAFGINCSCGPDQMEPWFKAMADYAKIPLIAKPNAGLPKLENGRTVFDMDTETFVQTMMTLIESGASIVGGCCGTTPEYVGALASCIYKTYGTDAKSGADWEALYENIYRMPQEHYKRVLTSERKSVPVLLDGQFTVIGERINPTGKKAFQAQLLNGSLDMAVDMAENQVNLGASVLDINVGMGGIDEKAMMVRTVARVSEAVDAPLCIDSSSIEVIEAALRCYHGRALVNSVSCEQVKLEKLLPVVKKYGAMFILLPLTDHGLPKDLEERKKNIGTVLDKAYELGFEKEDIVVDGLTGSVGASPLAASDTIETIAYARSLGLATVCGLSNISFGLPDRGYVNSIFLALALSRGLTMAIANPSQELLMRSGFAADLLIGKSGANIRYIEACQQYREKENADTQMIEKRSEIKTVSGNEKFRGDHKTASDDHSDQSSSEDIYTEKMLQEIHRDVLKGKSKAIENHLEAALKQGTDASVILNEVLIPAINLVGQYFSQQKYFLPQLILSADTMRRAVDLLEPEILKKNAGVMGPTVVIATVKGDVHDIGKNLVAMMMKNYGFHVIDLGKDVDKETIIDAARKHKAQIIALSALMTTTMQYMKEVIDYAAEENIRAKIIVGGAAVTKQYAEKIGADGYSEDAVGAVRLVQELLG
ncbi:MAG: homocysteine S-methyltransferase family protein [Clostridiales bacterium]|nr:homocysteine S-methyltransferase family protein [Clostridiales bacterium]MDY3746499.1 homocysteine S-methyltransferase family protein [Lachnospiraceae bacterium]